MADSLRYLTQVQFSDGTVLSGKALEDALHDLVSGFNAIKARWLRRRWTQSQHVGGYLGVPFGVGGHAQPALPWMTVYNDKPSSYIGSQPNYAPQNRWRLKGHRLADVKPELSGASDGEQYAYTVAWYFSRATLVQGLFVMLHTDAAYNNSFEEESNPVENFIVQLSIDSRFSKEERRLNNALINRVHFSLEAAKFNRIALPGSWDDMVPAHPGGVIAGRVLDMQDLWLPIPEDSRVRMSFIIPSYNSTDSPWENSAGKPWEPQYYSWALTTLESLR